MASSKFSDDQRFYAREQLKACGVPRDQLPYTDLFEKRYQQFLSTFPMHAAIGRNEYWRLLASVAKQGGMAIERDARVHPGD